MHASSSFPVLLQDRFAATLLGLCEEASAQGVRDRLMAPLLAVLCRRLYGVMSQVTRALSRLQAGRLPVRRRPGAARVRVVADDATAPIRACGIRLRYGWAWMIRMAPRVAQYAPQVQVLLDDPEMQAALAGSPSLRRALRPLCRGLAFPVPPVMVEGRRHRPRAGGSGRTGGCPAETVAAMETRIEAEVPSPLRPPMAWPGGGASDPIRESVPIPNRNPRPGGRDSPGVAPAVLRSFTR